MIVYVVVVFEAHIRGAGYKDMEVEKVRAFTKQDAARAYALDQVDEKKYPEEFAVEVEGTEEGVRA